ncbi:transcriptional regulator [Lactococcus cremoris]|uniref:transcriptional regulator n=1 Tax=Lactococcus lactis subsp. cremoris TaxID=1359 RepID=UPI001E40FF80|nr:transcriptional regulator [Lactococcus cremoris]MCD6632037.1 transcriptional regulator [Lactococcus cremoris]
MENKDKVLRVFETSSEILDAKGISELLGLDKKEVTKIIAKLKKEGSIISPKRCYYSLANK